MPRIRRTTSGHHRVLSNAGVRQADTIRLDSHVYENYAVPPYYDSMLAKLIVTGADRAAAIDLGKSALARFQVAGLERPCPFMRGFLSDPNFACRGPYTLGRGKLAGRDRRWLTSEHQSSRRDIA